MSSTCVALLVVWRGYYRDKTPCILSPQLLDIYGDHTIRKALEHWADIISIEEKRTSDLRYADDTILITSDEEKMAVLMNLVKIASEKLGPRINASKTKVIVMDQAKCLPCSFYLSERIRKGLHFPYIYAPSSKQIEARRQKYNAKSLYANQLWPDRVMLHVITRSPQKQGRDLYNHLFSLFSYVPRKHERWKLMIKE